MSTVRLRIEGVEQVKRNFTTLSTGIDRAAVRVLKKIAADVKDEAKELVPVDTGALQKSIRVITTAKVAGNITRVGVRAGGFVVNPKTGKLVNYAIPIEFGWSKKAPQGYLILAANKKAVPILRGLFREIREITRRFR